MSAPYTLRGKGRARAFAAAATAFLASCWHPAFDPGISGSESVISRLGPPIFDFTVDDVRGYRMDTAWFLPSASNPIIAGLLLRRDMYRVWAVSGSSGADVLNAFGALYTAYADPSGAPSAFLAADPARGRLVDPMNTVTLSPVPYPGGPASTFGVGFARTDGDPTIARGLWIGMGVTGPGYSEEDWTGGVPSFDPPADLVFPDHGLVHSPGTAFRTAVGHLFLACGLLDGSRAIYRWTSPGEPPVRFPEVHGPLVGALSDGSLLAERDGILTVLDADLQRRFSFPAGRLRFVHERWDGARMLAIFTRTIFARTERHDDLGRLKVEVYEIPTQNL
ncbi:MAG TPA: hypothetical protein VLH39_08090, partial [Magnetospirillaceae bacterium]|nr:hypothetical protein [Magnetospirillaceae bacterium]